MQNSSKKIHLVSSPSAPLPAAVESQEFLRDMQLALAAPVKCISPKHFYDAPGSALFDRICELPEYYPTRTELHILQSHAGDIAQRVGPHAEVLEFGAGSLRKIRLLLGALETPSRYVPVDISGEQSAPRCNGASSRLYAVDDYASGGRLHQAMEFADTSCAQSAAASSIFSWLHDRQPD